MFVRSFPWVTLTLIVAMASLFGIAGAIPEAWIYDRSGVFSGESWRLFSGHLTHSDSGHLYWNLSAAAVLGALLERKIGSRLIALTFSGMLTIDLMLMIYPSVAFYTGFSGVLNTWLAAILIIYYRDATLRPVVVLTAVGVLLKLLVEWQIDSAIFTNTAWPSLPAAHLAGLFGGIVWWLMLPDTLGRHNFIDLLKPKIRGIKNEKTL